MGEEIPYETVFVSRRELTESENTHAATLEPSRARGNLRELVETPRFAASKARIQPDAKRMDEALRGVGFVLSRKPELGRKASNPDIWAIATDELPGAAPLAIYYSFDAGRVYLEDIVLAKASDG